MTFPATSNMHKLIYVTDTIGWSRVQPSLLGEARGTERAAEIEPINFSMYNKYGPILSVEQKTIVETRIRDYNYGAIIIIYMK